MLNFLADNADALQALAAIVSVTALLPAAIVFIFNQAEERQARKEAKYLELDSQYRGFLQIALDHPRLTLDLCNGPTPRSKLTADEKVQRDTAIDLLVSIFERAFVLYAGERDSFRREQWAGWQAYIDEHVAREDFQEFWLRVLGEGDWDKALAPGASQYDQRFEAFLFDRLRRARGLGAARDKAAATVPPHLPVSHAGAGPLPLPPGEVK